MTNLSLSEPPNNQRPKGTNGNKSPLSATLRTLQFFKSNVPFGLSALSTKISLKTSGKYPLVFKIKEQGSANHTPTMLPRGIFHSSLVKPISFFAFDFSSLKSARSATKKFNLPYWNSLSFLLMSRYETLWSSSNLIQQRKNEQLPTLHPTPLDLLAIQLREQTSYESKFERFSQF